MAWIESHQSLGTHRKTKRLARELHIGIPQAIGHLHLVWWWCLDNAQDGNLQNIDHHDIADAGLWRKDADMFFEALIVSEFIDRETCVLHDWFQYAGKLIVQRDLTREQRQAGGRSRMGQLTPEERSTLARQAARSRWSTNENASSDAKSPSIGMPATGPTGPTNHIKENIKEKNTQPQKITGAEKPVFVLPDWIKKETWDAFLEVRRRKRAIPTATAMKLLVRKLEVLRASGNDPNEVLEQSVMNSYTGVFELKKGGNGAKNRGNPRQLPARDSYTRPEELRTGTG